LHAGNFPGTGSSANAPPVTHTYRMPAPAKGPKIVVISIRFANGFLDGKCDYAYFWKDGPARRRP